MKHVKVDDGLVYVSMDALESIVNQIVTIRDQHLDPSEDAEALAGSDATLGLLVRVLSQMREAALDDEDLSDELAETIKGLYDFLDEQ